LLLLLLPPPLLPRLPELLLLSGVAVV